MSAEIIILIFLGELGILTGIFTGLFPGIHINLVAVMIVAFSEALLQIVSPVALAVFIIAMSITHTFVDFIPSIFLGAPDENSFLSILPGHQLLLKGQGYFAVRYTAYGGLIALGVMLLFIPFFIGFLPLLYPYLQNIMGPILIVLSLYLIFVEDKKIASLIVFLLAGFLGIATLNLNIKEPLLPLLSGLFGASGLLISLKQNTTLPEQKIVSTCMICLSKESLWRVGLASIIASPFTAFLPGLGASQAAIIGQQSFQIKDQREFLFLIGAINLLVMGLSFITLYAIGKTRTGSAVAVSQLIPEPTIKTLVMMVSVILCSGIASFFITLFLSRIIAKNINRISYQKTSKIVLIIVTAMVIIFSDFFSSWSGTILGIVIFVTATALGIFTISQGVKRIHLMGCLLIPTILYYIS